MATERLSRMADGRLLYRLKHRWRDGTTHVVFEPGELVEKLAALVPPPRFHLVRYHGMLGPCASQRARVVPASVALEGATHAPERTALAGPGGEEGARGRPALGEDDSLASVIAPEGTPLRELSPGEGDVERPATARGESTDPRSSPADEPPLRPRRLAWADLLRRVFAIDVLECLDLAARAPPLEPARRDVEAPDPWEAAFEGDGF